MAKQRRQLSNAFNELDNKEQENEQLNKVQATEQEDVTQEGITEQETEEVISQDTSETSQEAHTEVLEDSKGKHTLTVKDIADRLQERYQEKANRPTVEDTHIRTTFLFRKDLAKRLDKLTRNKRGYKTQFINEAIEALLNEIE